MLIVYLLLFSQPIPLESRVYPILDRFETKGYLHLPSTRPFDRRTIREQVEGLSFTGIDSVLAEELKQELDPGYPVDKRLAPRPFTTKASGGRLALVPGIFFDYGNSPVRGAPVIRAGADVSGWGRLGPFDFSEKIKLSRYFSGFDSSAVDGVPWRDAYAFEIQSAAMSVGGSGTGSVRNYVAGIGKTARRYGPSRFGGLILSPHSFGIDGLNLDIRIGDLYLTTFFSILEPGRFLSSHRLDFVKTRFALGFTEMILYSRTVEPEYLIPIVPYYAVQWLKDRDDNIIWAVDGSIRLKNIKCYAEFLIDDLMYDPTTRAPDKLGFTAGLRWADPLNLPGTDLIAEYTRINKWVYTQRHAENRFVRNLATDRPLGDSIGPDADLVVFQAGLRLSSWFAVNSRFSLGRKGEGTVDLPYEEEGGSPTPPFPSGVVERKILTDIGLDIRPHWILDFEPRIGWEWIANRDHVRADNRSGLRAGVSLRVNF